MSQIIEGKGAAQEPENAGWSGIGESLSRALESVGISRIGVGAIVLASTAFLSGCSPQANSYMFSTFTDLPAPPPEARMQLGVSTEDDGTVFINYVVWDSAKSEFLRKDIHYTTTLTGPGTFSAAGGYQQKIHHGEVLYGDAIVDQKEGKIILSNGNSIDGKTGAITNHSGQVVFDR